MDGDQVRTVACFTLHSLEFGWQDRETRRAHS